MKRKLELVRWLDFDPATKRLMDGGRISPHGEGFAIMAWRAGRPNSWWFQGFRAVPTCRRRKDGRTMGQVRIDGETCPVEILRVTLENGESLDCALRVVPVVESQPFIAPWPLATYEDAMQWRSGPGGIHRVSRAAFAKSIGWRGPDVKEVLDLVNKMVEACAEDKYGNAGWRIGPARENIGDRVRFPGEP